MTIRKKQQKCTEVRSILKKQNKKKQSKQEFFLSVFFFHFLGVWVLRWMAFPSSASLLVMVFGESSVALLFVPRWTTKIFLHLQTLKSTLDVHSSTVAQRRHRFLIIFGPPPTFRSWHQARLDLISLMVRSRPQWVCQFLESALMGSSLHSILPRDFQRWLHECH